MDCYTKGDGVIKIAYLRCSLKGQVYAVAIGYHYSYNNNVFQQ